MRGIYLVDWEHFRKSSPAFDDLLHYCVSYALSSKHSRTSALTALRRAFVLDTTL